MLKNIRNFANTKFAGILVTILIIPFVFWGMGGLFSGGNKNNIAKINKENISTKDFQDHLILSNVELEKIKKNIDNNIIEENLGKLISIKMLSMEIENLDLNISDKILNKKIKSNKNFHDENNKFSRIKYEKFLLSNNLTAPEFEFRLRKNELKEDLFNFISGGLSSPLFLVNNIFKNQTKKITINYVNLSKNYKNKENITDDEISKYIEDNKDALKEKFINFKYAKITPKSLIGLSEFNNLFFEKIDELENEVLNGTTFSNLQNKYNLEINFKENFNINNIDEKKEFYKEIYKNNEETKKIKLLDLNDFYIVYEITNIQKILPDIKNEKFSRKVKEIISNKSKFDFNTELIKKISDKKFTQIDFDKLAKNNSTKIEINSIIDHEKFSTDSIKYLYALSKNDFALISDKDMNIYLSKIIDIKHIDISKNTENFLIYKKKSNDKIKNYIYDSYDFFINSKYKVKINEKTLERVKNYFR